MLAVHQPDNGRMASQSGQSPNVPGDDGIMNAELTLSLQGYSSSAPLLTSTLLENDTFQPLQQQQQQQHQQEQELLLQVHLQHIQQPPPQHPFAHLLHPLQSPEKARSPTSTASVGPWAFDYPPLLRGNSSSATQAPGLLTRSLNQLHPLQQTPPQTLSRAQGQNYVIHQQQQQQQQALSAGHGPLASSFSVNFPSTPSNAGQASISMLGQQDTLAVIPDMFSWGEQSTGASKTDIFQLTSPPMTPSGVTARSPNSYGGTPFVYGQHHKRPPLWPMDRPPLLPLPRQTLTPQQSSKAANLQYVPCKFFKSGACTAGKNCLFSHSRDVHSENHVCKYFLKGNCKFGSKCSLSHSFLSADRKSSAMNLNTNNGSTSSANQSSSNTSNGNQSGRARLERRASSGAIANSFWPSEPLSPPFGPPLNHQGKSMHQPHILQTQHPMRLDRSASQEFSISRSPSQPALYSRNMLTRSTTENFRHSYSLNGALKQVHDMAPSPSLDGAGSSPESNSLASTFGSSSLDLGMASVNGSLNTFESRSRQHLAAPLPIRQRSLPDIFRLGPCSGSFASTSTNDQGGAGANSLYTGQMPSSPFYPTGSKAMFLGVHFDHDGAQSSPIKLHSIPERFHQQPSAAPLTQNPHQHQQLHQQYTLERGASNYNGPLSNNVALLNTSEAVPGDFGLDEEGDLKTDLGYLPSSLSELLNNGDRQSQQGLEENTATVQPANILPSPASTLREDKDEEGGGHDRSISSATTLGASRDPLEAFRTRFQSSMDDLHRDARLEHNGLNRVTEGGLEFSAYKGIDGSGLFSHGAYEVGSSDPKSSASTSFHPLSSQFNGLFYDDYGRLDQSQFPRHQSHFSVAPEAYNGMRDTFSREVANTTSRSGTPDPFCPFPQEADEVQFAMDDDLPAVTTCEANHLGARALGLGLYGEPATSSPPPGQPSPPMFSAPNPAAFASTLQSSTSRHLGDLDKLAKHDAQGESTADNQDMHGNLVALMSTLDMAETSIYSI